jgi:hypothetical protein
MLQSSTDETPYTIRIVSVLKIPSAMRSTFRPASLRLFFAGKASITHIKG